MVGYQRTESWRRDDRRGARRSPPRRTPFDVDVWLGKTRRCQARSLQKMHSTAVKLVASRAVARSPGQRIIGGMVGRPRPSPLDGEHSNRTHLF